ncbi:uncharacterized protein BT62DRAFT_1080650 [Guyanagaster necrorhizus]|uniref:Uncharacterized protein n=1 Tax=Guyanagaster necrorhizus TaxID=856835 RepID=A0A9P8ANE1_9AGAR|nr:uncharacterized protein BT62DRAFT_1080650 [Guyanagaster necrorhizus MCA 3950]KAG7440797.1 hypothetical protein BT62DRAFT_1080650 [Guyanagaster necrorhizus MCA 3950]
MGGFFWFLIGAGTATIWSHHHRNQPGFCGRTEYTEGYERRGYGPWGHGWHGRSDGQNQKPRSDDLDRDAAPPPAPPPPAHPPVAEGQAYTMERQAYTEPPSSVDKERLRELSRQAGDAMSELSEATLDSLMSTILVAKNKLADRRIQRDLEEKRVADAAEREKKFPPRYV